MQYIYFKNANSYLHTCMSIHAKHSRVINPSVGVIYCQLHESDTMFAKRKPSVVLFLLLLCTTVQALSSKTINVGKIQMSPIGIGTWSWGNRFLWNYKSENDGELFDAFKFSISKGVNWFDTADSYGTGSFEGRSEELLGQFTASSPSSRVYLCTKIAPFPWRIGKNSMLSSIEKSCNRLQRPIDMVQLHWPPTFGWQENAYLDAFSEAVSTRQALQVGLSNFGPAGLNRINKKLLDRGLQAYSNQVQFSLLSRLPLENGLYDMCKASNVQLISYSPLALGLLADKYTLDRLPTGPRSILFREYLPTMKPLLDELRSIAKYRKKSVAQVALNWNLRKGFLVLVGARSVQQVQDSIDTLTWILSPSEVECIDRAARKVPKSLIQNANQSN